MNKKLNLVEILKDCPEGTKLYSTICGEVKLSHIENEVKPFKNKYNMYMLDQLVLSLLDTINEIPDEDKNNDVSELKKVLLKYAKNNHLQYE